MRVWEYAATALKRTLEGEKAGLLEEVVAGPN